MLAAWLGAVGRIGADAFAAEGGKERSKRPNYNVASRFARRVAGAGGSVGANAPRPRRLATPASAASKSCHYHNAFPGGGLPIGCPSSARTECQSTRRGPAHVAARPIPMLRAPATTAQSAPTNHLKPMLGPFFPPATAVTHALFGNHQTAQFAWTVLIDGLRADLSHRLGYWCAGTRRKSCG